MTRIVTVVVLSFLCPGMGQYYNKDYKKGSLILVLTTLMVLLPAVWIVRATAPLLPDAASQGEISPEMIQSAATKVISENRHTLNLISFVFLGLWAYAITEAYFKAKELMEKEEPKEDGP